MALQFTLPKRRAVVKSGILRGPRREWPRHRKFVRSHGCCVPGCEAGPVVFARVRSAENSGVALKPGDWNGISLCDAHHRIQYSIGQPEFEKRHGIDMAALADAFTRASPDAAMKASLEAVELRGERDGCP